MFVRQLIGRAAGTIQDLPYHAATAALACGTCSTVSDEEITAAGLAAPPRIVADEPERVPQNYRVEPDQVTGFNVVDPGGVQLNTEPFTNAAAARSFAHNHYKHAAGQSAAQASATVMPPVSEASTDNGANDAVYADDGQVDSLGEPVTATAPDSEKPLPEPYKAAGKRKG